MLPLAAPLPWQVSHSASVRHLDLHLVAEHRLRQIQLELVAQVGAAEHLRAAAAARAAEDVAEHVAEDVAEAIGAEAAAAAAARGRLEAGVTVLVVGGALVRVGEHLVGLLGLLEVLLGLLVVRDCDPDDISSRGGGRPS